MAQHGSGVFKPTIGSKTVQLEDKTASHPLGTGAPRPSVCCSTLDTLGLVKSFSYYVCILAPNPPDASSKSTLVKTRKTHTKSRGAVVSASEESRKLSPGTREPHDSAGVRRIERFFLVLGLCAFACNSQLNRQFGFEDMELWHHYIKYTFEATSVMFGGKPELGLSCDYLLHGMLATAAIHLAYLQPENRAKYNLLSRQHQDLALGPFQRAMTAITDENADNLFAYGTLLMVCSLASSESIPPSGSNEPSSGIADWVIFVRGCRSISVAAKSDIGGLPIKEWNQNMVQIQCTEENAAKLSPEEARSFDRIETLLTTLPSISSMDDDEEVTALLTCNGETTPDIRIYCLRLQRHFDGCPENPLSQVTAREAFQAIISNFVAFLGD
ncbi:hypothetical protein DL98DRAFT_538515 [Cadophora sp. DSE1049]|nr:hypothetical protein DL98DRAFT_538515 [Cadophora sp. DSE1049]